MAELFLKVLNMSIRSSWVLLAVFVLRIILHKGPTWFPMTLWAVAAVRLVCPHSITSPLSLIPNGQVVDPGIMTASQPMIDSGIPVIDQVINPVLLDTFTPSKGTGMNPLQYWIPIFVLVWLIGSILLLGYMIISYCHLYRHVRDAVYSEGRVYFSEKIRTPFVLGVLKPKIYLPYEMGKTDREYVLFHEQTHIQRLDHWWKPIGYLILAIHWFNPLVWFAYILFCKDIEVACDKAVVKQLSPTRRADYSQALVNCCAEHARIGVCPIAFGEISIKERVKTVLNYKKPAFWLILISFVVCVAAVFCLLTDPVGTSVPADSSYSETTPTESGEDVPIDSTPAESGEGPNGLPTPQI